MIAFAHIQKTAGTTINRILRQSFGVRHCDVEPLFESDGYFSNCYSARDHQPLLRLYPDISSIAGHRVKPCSDLSQVCSPLVYFMFFREPVERTASHFQYNVQSMGYEGTIEEWATNEDLHNLQTKHIAGSDNVDEAIDVLLKQKVLVGLISRFNESLVILNELMCGGKLDIRYKPKNVAPRTTIKRELLADKQARSVLAEINQKDTVLYRYVCEELYPSQQRKFGPHLETAVEEFIASKTPPAISLNYTLNVIKRNLLYKPWLRYSRWSRSHDSHGKP